MEMFDIYTENREKTNRTIERGTALEKNDYRLVVHACIINDKNEMLIQQRQPFKSGWANMWDITVGGSVIAGETSKQAVQRELFEELGINIDFSDIRPQFTINFENGFDDIYIIQRSDIDITTLKLQYEEVQRVKWASFNEIQEMLHNGTFIPYYESLINLIFSMKNNYGCFLITESTN
ncbi:MAG: NUDIX domain-containing protein [Acutalibacteraceae bacterium]|nr:NUDIX domain-containing protein [Acutalibacteraceae bacterium]